MREGGRKRVVFLSCVAGGGRVGVGKVNNVRSCKETDFETGKVELY